MAGMYADDPETVRAKLNAELDIQQRRAQEKADQMQFIAAMNQQGISIGQIDQRGLSSASGNNAAWAMGWGTAPQAPKPMQEKEGVLFWQGRELPEVWRGAEYKIGARSFNATSRQWKIEFRSDFSKDTIMLWLDPDKHSGEEADKIAATYLETINQRRLG